MAEDREKDAPTEAQGIAADAEGDLAPKTMPLNRAAASSAADEVPLPSAEDEAKAREAAPDLGMSEADETVEGNMSLVRHLEELRQRIIRSLIAIGIGSCVAYVNKIGRASCRERV